MSDNDFSDIEVEALGFGSLGGAGAEHHDTVKSKVVADGMSNQIRCEGCGKTLVLTIPWAELIFLSVGQLPQNGSFIYNPNRGCFMPANACSCGANVRLGVTPDECVRNLKSGIAAKKISLAYIQQFKQQYRLP